MTPDIAEAIASLEKWHGRRLIHRRAVAQRYPWDGRRPFHPDQRMVVDSVDQVLAAEGIRVSSILSLDSGPHSSGWWRNSDYDRCWHLSLVGIAFLKSEIEFIDVPAIDRAAWSRLIFGNELTRTWTEPPASEHDPHRNAPASRHTIHVRLFLDQQNRPITPIGEVYTLKPWADGTSPAKVFR